MQQTTDFFTRIYWNAYIDFFIFPRLFWEISSTWRVNQLNYGPIRYTSIWYEFPVLISQSLHKKRLISLLKMLWSMFCAIFTVSCDQLYQRWMCFSYRTSMLWHHRVTGPTRYTSTSSHARLTLASTISATLCSSGFSDSAAMFVSRSIFSSKKNDSRPLRSKAATYSESAIKILLASTFDNMCHKTGLEPCFHISLFKASGGRARELIKTSHTAPTR